MQPPSFSRRVLARLRAEGYQPRAWGRMLADSWAQARETARAHGDLVRGWRMLVGGLGSLTGLALVATGKRHGRRAMWHTAVPMVAAHVIQASDIYVHLGLHRGASGEHFTALGAANGMTALRGWVAGWIGSRLVADMPLADDELLLAIVLICITDIADGRVARHLGQTSPLGRYLDGEADLLAGLALTMTQIRRGQVPAWFLAVFGLRWGLPVVVGLARTFAEAEMVALQPSPIARAAGVAQVAMSLVAVIAAWPTDEPPVATRPSNVSPDPSGSFFERGQIALSINAPRGAFGAKIVPIWHTIRHVLLGITTVLLGAATVGQVLRLLRPNRSGA